MRLNRCGIFTATLLVALALCAARATADQHSGTWKMNPEKSKYSPGPPAKNLTLVVEADASGVKIDSQGTDGEGKPTHVQYDAKFDGKDYPVTGLSYGDMVTVKRIDANTLQTSIKKGDQVVMTVTSKVSADGKTRTSTFKGKDAEGHAVNNTVVYDKR
jgi:hypothetical protein